MESYSEIVLVERKSHMKTIKRNNYEKVMDLNGIDTLSGYISNKVSIEDLQKVKKNVRQCNYRPTDDRTYLLINPNKNHEKEEKLITSYSEFLKKMDYIIKSLGADPNDLDIIRADFCFNSRDESTFEDYQKLHRLIISCLADTYKFRNCYVSCDLWDYDRLSIAIKKDDCEIENYNKHKQSDGTDESANRLELRSKRMSGTSIKYQFMVKWFDRLDKAIEHFESVQQKANMHLERLYQEDLIRDKKDRKYVSLTAFLIQYKESIYTSKQMIDLLSRFDEVANPQNRAKKFKEKHNIEYFSKRDLEHIVRILKQKTLQYFNS